MEYKTRSTSVFMPDILDSIETEFSTRLGCNEVAQKKNNLPESAIREANNQDFENAKIQLRTLLMVKLIDFEEYTDLRDYLEQKYMK